VPGYHIEIRTGAKKCGHQGGKVLVSGDEQIKRLNAPASNSTSCCVAGIIGLEPTPSPDFHRKSSDSAISPSSRSHQPRPPSYKVGYLAILKKLSELGVDGSRGHLLVCRLRSEYAAAFAWLERSGLTSDDRPERQGSQGYARKPESRRLSTKIDTATLDLQKEARPGLWRGSRDRVESRIAEGQSFDK